MKKAYLYSRVSSVSQSEQGEGITRQIENAKAFLKNYPEYIIANDVFTDAASGFSGANLEDNAGLGSFINSAERGEIPKGSLLVIESPDRLSRLGIKKGQRIFDRIMECGIDIALVRFGIILKHDDENDFTGSLIVAVGLYLGNLESQQKSERINFSLQKKKIDAAAGGEKYSGRSPAWLKLSKDRMSFELVPDNVEAVRLMFNLRATGSSFGQIEQALNDQGIKPFTAKAKRWYEPSISKILHYRQVLGENQFYKQETIDGKKKRVPDGEVIPHYYPQIISDDIFQLVQAKFREKKSGKISEYKNLFSGLTRCSCGAARSYAKPNKNRDLVYLRCKNYLAKPKLCELGGIKYPPVEVLLLKLFRALDYSKLSSNYDDSELIKKQAEVEKSQQGIDTFNEAIDSYEDPTMLKSLLPKVAAMQSSHNLLLEELSVLQLQRPTTQTSFELQVDTEQQRTVFNNLIGQHVNSIIVHDDYLKIDFKHKPILKIIRPKKDDLKAITILTWQLDDFYNLYTLDREEYTIS